MYNNNNKNMLENCRFYVCKINNKTDCVKFDDYQKYFTWINEEDNIVNTHFVPICNCYEKLDKFILIMRKFM